MGTAELDYEVFKRKILKKTGFNLNAYKQAQMERRLRCIMDRIGAVNFQEYFRMMETDDKLLNQFLDRVTINVTEMFRNPEQFVLLEKTIIPIMLETSRSLNVWSAGCSYGHEPYSLAISLEETSPIRKHKIVATDIDPRALEHAKVGVYSIADAKNVDSARIQRWFTSEDNKLTAKKRLQDMIEFRHLDLLKDSYPCGMDLIVCRNVVIYFTDEAKSELYKKMFRALKPGGFLFIGSTERVNNYAEIGYLNPYPFIYRKVLNIKEN